MKIEIMWIIRVFLANQRETGAIIKTSSTATVILNVISQWLFGSGKANALVEKYADGTISPKELDELTELLTQ